MLAVIHEKANKTGQLAIQDINKPQIADNEVLIRVAYAGVNRPDLLQRYGHYPPPIGHSSIMGLEVSGWIDEVGQNVHGLTKGQKVFALTNGGGYAEYCAVPAGQCLALPSGINLEESAAIPETFFTAWHNLIERGMLQPGKDILIHGGGGGVSSASIQLARFMGARVFCTAGSINKVQFAERLGAVLALNYHEQNFDRLKENTLNRNGFDLILDMIGATYFQQNIQLLAPEGRLVQIATQQGSKVEFDLRQLLVKRITLTGSTLRAQSNEVKSRIAANFFQATQQAFVLGQIKPFIQKIFPLAEVDKAHQLMQEGQLMGKLILRVIA